MNVEFCIKIRILYYSPIHSSLYSEAQKGIVYYVDWEYECVSIDSL